MPVEFIALHIFLANARFIYLRYQHRLLQVQLRETRLNDRPTNVRIVRTLLTRDIKSFLYAFFRAAFTNVTQMTGEVQLKKKKR